MQKIDQTIEELYAKYACCLEEIEGAADYLNAIQQLSAIYERLGHDAEIMLLLVELLLDEYVDFSDEVSEFLEEKDFVKLRHAASHFHNSIRNAASDSKVMAAVRIEEACKNEDFKEVYTNWLALHVRLIPMMSVFKQFYQQARNNLPQC